MTSAHQQFSARTRANGEVDKPGKRRRNLSTGRISVVLGVDAACVMRELAGKDSRSVGGLIRRIVLDWLEKEHKLSGSSLAMRAAVIRTREARNAKK
jgi:hypothetical protein